MGDGYLCTCERAPRRQEFWRRRQRFCSYETFMLGGEGLTSLSETTPMRRPMLVT